jgi:acyl carrier protein
MEQTEIRAELVAFLNTVVRPGQTVDAAGDGTNLIDSGVIDSLALIQIISWLEDNHDVRLHTLAIDPSELASINGILNAIGRSNAG